MQILLFLFGVLFGTGLFMLLANALKIPYLKTSNGEQTLRYFNQSFQRICSKYQQAERIRRLYSRVRGLQFGL